MNRRAFGERVTAMQGSLYRVAASYLRGESDRLDAVAEAIAKAWEKRQTLRVEYPDDGWTRTPEGDAALDARRVAAGFSAARYNHVLPEPGMLTEQDALALARQVLESDGGLSADVLNDPESEMYAVCTQEDGKTVWTVWHHNAVGICAVTIDAADGTILDMIIDTGMAGNG